MIILQRTPNENLRLVNAADRNFTVLIKHYNNEWYDITKDVKEIEINHAFTYLSNKYGADEMKLTLHNEKGQYDTTRVVSAVNSTTNEFNTYISELNKPFLYTIFPIKVFVTSSGATNLVFAGFVTEVKSENTTANFKCYDIFSIFARKKLRKNTAVVNEDASKALRQLLLEPLAEINTTFNETFKVTINGVDFTAAAKLKHKVMLEIGGDQSYLSALNELLSKLAGGMSFIPFKKEIAVYLPTEWFQLNEINPTGGNISSKITSNSNYANIFTFNAGEVIEYKVETETDRPNSINVTTKLYEIQNKVVKDYLAFASNDNVNNAPKIFANSWASIEISFSQKGLPVTEDGTDKVLIVKRFDLQTFTYEIDAQGNFQYLPGARARLASTGAPLRLFLNLPSNSDGQKVEIIYDNLPVSDADKYLTIKEVQVSLDKIKLLIKNNTNYNFAVHYVSFDAVPLFEAGEGFYHYYVNEPFVNETSLEIGYFTNQENLQYYSALVSEIFFWYNPKVIVELTLNGYYFDIQVGGIVKLNLPDTSFSNIAWMVHKVIYEVKKGFVTTKVTLGSPSENFQLKVDSVKTATIIPKLQQIIPPNKIYPIIKSPPKVLPYLPKQL